MLALPCRAQDQTSPQQSPPRRDINAAPIDEEDARLRLEREMAKKANEERHAALKTDADKLLKMAVELKGYVDKSNEHVLSVDVIKKAEEIEKLAHRVKEKMKGPN
jgi:hypothetical protein